MVSDAIVFFDECGPSSKTSLHLIVSKREKSIAFLQDYILKLNEKLAEMKSEPSPDNGIGFDADTGLFHFRD